MNPAGELAEAVVRAERSLARQAARLAAASRISAARYADTLAVLALLLPWSQQRFDQTTIVRNGMQSSGWVASLALMGILLRQVVLTAVAAQPDRRGPLTLTTVGTVTCTASVVALARLPVLAERQGAPHVELVGPLLYGAAAVVAAVLTVAAGRSIATARSAPDLLAGLHMATAEQVQVRLAAAEIAIRRRTADPLPAAGVLGMVVAVAGAQTSWADPFAVRWLIAIAMGAVMVLAVVPVRRSVAARAQVVAGAVSMLLTLRAVLMVDSGVAEANGAWLSLAGAAVTTLCGLAVLLGRHARRVQLS